MSISMPTTPSPVSAVPRYVDYGSVQQGPLGGAAQRLNRLGNRWALSVVMPPMIYSDGMAFLADLIAAQTRGAIMPFPQPDLIVGAPGAAVVDGAGQSGETLAIRGASPGYVFRKGQFFNVGASDRAYLYQVRANATVAANGRASLPISPMLRTFPLDGTPLILTPPVIEGFVTGDQREWMLSVERNMALAFEIIEAR